MHWLAHALGLTSANGGTHLFWSGVCGDLGLIGGAAALLRHANCHSRRYWRIGRHTTPDGYRLCRRCVARPKADLGLHKVHADHFASHRTVSDDHGV